MVLAPLGLPACAGDIGSPQIYSPDEPEQFDPAQMYNQQALAQYENLEDRAYVMGHATGVYLMGKTLPQYVVHKGYLYRPGKSSSQARIGYEWEAVLRARSGGSDGRGGIIYSEDDVGGVPEDECGNDDSGQNGNGDDVPMPPEDCEEPPTPECMNPPCDDGSGDPGDGGDPDGPGTDDPIDPDCESFLDPAGVGARSLGTRVDPGRLLGDEFAGANRPLYEAAFTRGLQQALKIQDFNENAAYSEVEHLKEHVRGFGLCEYSPLVLDLDGDGVRLSGVAGGVRFDLQENGRPLRTAWTTGRDAWLVLDRDGDGAITSGAELFGESTRADGGHFADGFAALAELDGNADGVIDLRDPAYYTLRLWIDADRNGVSTPDELSSLIDEGVTSLSLAHQQTDERDAHGNALRLQGTFSRESADGTCQSGQLVDAWLKVRN